ncbi:diphosphomevalonate decarboxylase [Saitoella coloradoensis]
MELYQATTTAPVNIAVIKYWGKRDAKLNLPTNSSLSVTLSQDDLRALTTASCSPTFTEDRLWLNGVEESVATSSRLTACIDNLRQLRAELEQEDPSAPKLSTFKLHICSENNFPTAAGLASSAAGFAALVRAIADLYQLPQSAKDLSRIARQGSGSACRSLMGGYVSWEMGEADDGNDSLAEQVAPQSHWPEMRAAVLVVSAERKTVPSTAGMQATVATSALFRHRADVVVPERMSAMKRAIKEKDFEAFADLTMKDSNQFHAVCLDTSPPIFYLNDISRACIRFVEELNRSAGKVIAAYTYDAGPNCVIYYTVENEEIVLGALKKCLANIDGWRERDAALAASLPEGFDTRTLDAVSQGITRLILTQVGGDPVSIAQENGLIGQDGLPKSLKGQ